MLNSSIMLQEVVQNNPFTGSVCSTKRHAYPSKQHPLKLSPPYFPPTPRKGSSITGTNTDLAAFYQIHFYLKCIALLLLLSENETIYSHHRKLLILNFSSFCIQKFNQVNAFHEDMLFYCFLNVLTDHIVQLSL